MPFIFWIHSWIWSPTPGQATHHWWRGAANFGSSSPGGPLATYPTGILVGFSILWFILIMVGGTLVQIMSQAAQLDASEDRPLTFEKLWSQARPIFWRMLGLYIVTALIVAVGFVLLIIPGVILLRRYFLAPYILLEKNVGVFEAMRQSAALSQTNPSSIYRVIGVMFLIGLLNIVPIIGGLAAFAVGSLYSIAPALRYQQLKQIKNSA